MLNYSPHAMTSESASNVKIVGHKKEVEFARRVNGDVVGKTSKPDVIKNQYRYSIKGALVNIQLFLLSFQKSEKVYGLNSPLYNYQLAAYNYRKFKYDNGTEDSDLFSKFLVAADNLATWLKNKHNFRSVIEKVCSDGYDANKLVVLKDIEQDALVYDMKEVVDLYTNSNYNVYVTAGAKIVIRVDNEEIFFIETRGSKGKIGSMNHGCRAPQFYSFLQKNLTYDIISR